MDNTEKETITQTPKLSGLWGLVQRFYTWLEGLDPNVRTAIYITLSGVFTLLSGDVVKLNTENLYLVLLFSGVSNILLYAAKVLGEKALDKRITQAGWSNIGK